MFGGRLYSHRRIAAAGAVIVLGGMAVGLGASGAAASSSYKLEIAVFSPFTGPNGEYGYFNYDGCVPAVDLINQAGGIEGHQLTCAIVDDRGDPADAVPAAQAMIAGSSHLVGLIDGNSGLLSATVPIISKAHVVELSVGGDPAFDKNTYPYFWRTTPGDDQAGYALAAYIRFDTPYRKLGAVFANDVAAQGNVPGLVAGAKNLGLTIVNQQAIALDQTSYATEVQQLIAAHPQIITTESDPQTAGVFLANLKQAGGLKPLVGTSGTVGNDYNKAATAALGASTYTKGFVRIIQYTATAGPAFKVWQPAMTAAPGIKDKSSLLTGFGPEVSYDHVTMEALAMLAAHSDVGSVYNSYIPKITTGKVVVNSFAQGKAALAKGETIDYVGLEGQIAFNKYHNSAGIWSADNPVTNATEKTVSSADLAKALGGK
jgi:branched-chain amino acid transport system substrate-binding protein